MTCGRVSYLGVAAISKECFISHLGVISLGGHSGYSAYLGHTCGLKTVSTCMHIFIISEMCAN